MLMYLLRGVFAARKAKRRLADAHRFFEAGVLEDAEQACDAVADVSPDLADVHYLRGRIELQRQRLELAVGHLEAAVRRRDSEASFHLTLAETFQKLGRHDRAATHFQRALECLAPPGSGRIAVMLQLAAALQASNDFDGAEKWHRKVLEIEPYNREALLRLAMQRFEESDAAEARSLMNRYIASPADAAARLRRALILTAIVQSNEQIEAERKRFEQELEELLGSRLAPVSRPEREVGTTAFYLAYHGRDNSALLRRLAQVCRSLYPARSRCERKLFASGRRLRIGFVSTFFHFHSVGRTTLGLIRDLPRDRFEVSVFAISPQPDELADAIRRNADHYVALPEDLERVRETIDAAALDMVLFADIGMHPLTYFLALWRLAPIQLTTWGHSVTSGIDTIDYYVSSDCVEPEESEGLYTEKLIRLPGYFMPRYPRPALEGPRRTRRELGLPEDAHVYYCPQNLFKLHPDFDATLRAILERDPQGGILLIESRKSWADLIRRRFARTLGAVASRVHFVGRVPYPEYLQYVAAADVNLDPFYFGGCNSSCEALSLAVPVVTLPSFQLPGRFTMGLYEEIELRDCVARGPEQFVEIAVRLGMDGDYRKAISAQIAARCERLFDRPDTGLALGDELLRIAETAR